MVSITKEEKAKVLERFPHAYIIRTVKHKSKRHHYYVEESSKIMAFLKEMRETGMQYSSSKEK